MKAVLISQASVLALLVLGTACAPASSGNDDAGSSGTGNGGSAGSNTTGGAGGIRVTTGGAGGVTVPPATGGGGATGAGGSTVVQKLCATKTTIVQPVLINFDNYTGTVTADMYGTAYGGTTANTGMAYTGPYDFGDGSSTPMLTMVGGHPPSMWAVGESVMQAKTWGMGGGLWMTSCANASAYKGISFWVRGTAPSAVFSFSVSMDSTVMPDATNPAGGGTCPGTAATCLPPTKTNIPLTVDWTQVTIMWADFAPGMSGATAVVPNGDNITGLGWSVPLLYALDPSAMGDAAGPYTPVAADLSINIDDIEFIP
jgi:hypothetical protein